MVIDTKLLANMFNQKKLTGEEIMAIIKTDMKKDREDLIKKLDEEEQKRIEKMELKSKKLDEKLQEHYDKGLKRVYESDKNSRNRLLYGLDKRGNKIYQKKMNTTERLEKAEKIHQNHLRKINDDTDKALRKLANRHAKDRVVTIAQNLVISNTISLEELTQLDIQYKTMSEICESITKKFGKTRLEHLDNDAISNLSTMDDYESGELIDLSSITRKQLGKGSSGIRDLVKEKERRKKSEEIMKEAERTSKESRNKSKEIMKEAERTEKKAIQNAFDEFIDKDGGRFTEKEVEELKKKVLGL